VNYCWQLNCVQFNCRRPRKERGQQVLLKRELLALAIRELQVENHLKPEVGKRQQLSNQELKRAAQ
jgi:hypothetical protein